MGSVKGQRKKKTHILQFLPRSHVFMVQSSFSKSRQAFLENSYHAHFQVHVVMCSAVSEEKGQK